MCRLVAGLLLFSTVSVGFAGEPAAKAVDVVVYGGTPCGIAAAIAAARSGASVVLVEPTRHVGGLNTSGINTAETEHMLPWTIGGIALEFYERLGRHYGTNRPEFFFESSVAEKAFGGMLADVGVEVWLGRALKAVEKDGAAVRRVVLSDGASLTGKVFVDAGYEGDLMAKAGVTYTYGRESRSEFGESLAGVRIDSQHRSAATADDDGRLLPGISARAGDLTPGAGDRKVMNYNFRLCFTQRPNNRVSIPAPAKYERDRYALLENWLRGKTDRGETVKLTDVIDLYGRRNGKFEVNNRQDAIISVGHFGGQFDWPDADGPTRDRIAADHKEYTLGLLHFLANDAAVPAAVRAEMRAWGLAKDEFADNGNWPYQLYVREARRMRGQVVVTQKDVQGDRRKDDSVGIASHFIDCHHIQRVALSPTAFANEGRIWRAGWAYQIPYRALAPKTGECSNLLVPGAASFTHVAYCTYRVESVWMIAGHAAGTAAASAARNGRPVQDIDIPALQRRLREQKQVVDFVPGKPEKFEGRVIEF